MQAQTLNAAHDWAAVDFISDVHLTAQAPILFERWARYMAQTSAHAVFILGDLFDAWVGDDAASLPFEAQCCEVLQQTARTKPVYFLAGNRDFLLSPKLLASLGVHSLSEPTQLIAGPYSVLLAHGDSLCLSDTAYQQFRQMVRNPEWQRAFLNKPLVERLGIAQAMRQASQEHQQQRPIETFGDIDAALAQQWLSQTGCRILVHGHTHQPQSEEWSEQAMRHVISDWPLHQPQESAQPEVLRWLVSAHTWQRLSAEHAAQAAQAH